jgi:predicted ATP-dependent protease
VCIPAANVKHLVPRDDVLAAIERGEFHLWSMEHIDEGIAMLTGLSPGQPQEAATFHGKVAQRLRQMLAALKEHQPLPTVAGMRTWRAEAELPQDPRPPMPPQP